MRALWLLALAACSAVAPVSDRTEVGASTELDAGICVECACRAVECGPDAAPPPCEECTSSEGCATGCCGKMHDESGAVVLGAGGQPRYGCVYEECASDDQCLPGLTCALGSTCDENHCVCPGGLPPWDEDPVYPCCQVRDLNGVCCTSGLVDTDTLLCVCSDAMMSDQGDGCVCPSDMQPDDDSGQCVCSARGAELSAESGACECPAGTTMLFDDYVGTVWCAGDDDPPPECGDEHAVFDVATGTCGCEPGMVLRTVDGYATPFCAPPLGDDAGVVEAADAGVVGGDVSDAGVDAGEPDGGVIVVRDAGVVVVADGRVEVDRDARVAAVPAVHSR